MAKARLIVALDVYAGFVAGKILNSCVDLPIIWKFGVQIIASGPGLPLAADLANMGREVFIDLKLLDIDNTVEKAVDALAQAHYRFTTVHAYPNAMDAAFRGRNFSGRYTPGRPSLQLLAVTALTSMDQTDFIRAGYRARPVEDLVLERAIDADHRGMDGVVASPLEAARIRIATRPDFLIVTPGIRPTAADDDQKRTSTPAFAINAGATHLVVGRPIIEAPDPRAAAEAILEEMEKA